MAEATSALETVDKSSSTGGFFETNPVLRSLRETYNAFQERREALGLPNPGTVEHISREVSRDVLLNNYSFTGFRADVTKAFSGSPLFQISHAFSMGTQGLPPYTLAALYGTDKVFMQTNLDNEGSLSARFNYRWNKFWVTKSSVQLAPGPDQAMVQLDNDFTGADFTSQIKSINPSILGGGLTGIFIGSYLQSVTPKLALGTEAVWQRTAMNEGPQSALSLCAKYRGSDWIASAQLLQQGGIQGTFWRKLGDKLEAGVDISLKMSAPMSMMGPPRREGLTTVGAKYDFRASTFRAQLDSAGKLSCVLEKRVAPTVAITFAGEMDHAKNAAKIGLAVSIETMNDELLDQQERGEFKQPSVPF